MEKRSSFVQVKIFVGSFFDVEATLNKFFLAKKLNEHDITFRRYELKTNNDGEQIVLAVVEYKEYPVS